MNFSALLCIAGTLALITVPLPAEDDQPAVRTYSGMAGAKRAEMLLAWDFPTDGEPDSKPYFYGNLYVEGSSVVLFGTAPSRGVIEAEGYREAGDESVSSTIKFVKSQPGAAQKDQWTGTWKEAGRSQPLTLVENADEGRPAPAKLRKVDPKSFPVQAETRWTRPWLMTRDTSGLHLDYIEWPHAANSATFPAVIKNFTHEDGVLTATFSLAPGLQDGPEDGKVFTPAAATARLVVDYPARPPFFRVGERCELVIDHAGEVWQVELGQFMATHWRSQGETLELLGDLFTHGPKFKTPRHEALRIAIDKMDEYRTVDDPEQTTFYEELVFSRSAGLCLKSAGGSPGELEIEGIAAKAKKDAVKPQAGAEWKKLFSRVKNDPPVRRPIRLGPTAE